MSESKTAIEKLSAEEKRERLGRILRARAEQQVRRFPLSFSQQRLWFLDEMEGGSTVAYTIPIVLRLQGAVKVDLIERAISEITKRHETLRTTFGVSATDGNPEQVVHPWKQLQLEVDDLAAEPEPWQAARQTAVAEARMPFDLKTGPLFRAKMLNLGSGNWVLLLTMHHIISDGWSVNLLINELSALYNAYSNGREPSLEELPIQYCDFAHWQREHLTREVLEPQMEYWRRQLARQPGGAALELPAKGPRPKSHSLDGAVYVWKIDRAASRATAALAKAEGVTLFMVLMAAFDVLLYRYSGQEDLFVGTPIANRNRREVEGLIGLFINTLVFRTNVSTNPTVRELLKSVRQTALDAYAHQDLPFEKLVEELQPERDISRTPFFQVMLVLQPPMPRWTMSGIEISPWVIEGSTSKFEMTLSIVEESDGTLQAWIEYNSVLFDARMIERFIAHFEKILVGMQASPEIRIFRLPLLAEAERRQILLDWNDSSAPYDPNCCAHEAVATQASRTPDSTALIFAAQHLSYRLLDRISDELAIELQSAGAGKESVVGICMQRSAELVVALLAVLKSGSAYLPLDPLYPKERLEFMLGDAGVKVLLVQPDLPGPNGDNIRRICLDEGWAQERGLEATAQWKGRPRLQPENLAYVIYTSGSTGKPKGVMTSHRGLCNLVLWMQMAFPLGNDDRMLQRTAFSFDASIWEFFWPLMSGAAVVVASPAATHDSDLLVRTMIDEEVTILQIVQSLFQILLEAGPVTQCRTLRHVFCGGEAMAPSLIRRFYSCLPQAQLHNVYGPTEASMHVTHWKCPRSDQDATVPIGKPVGNTQVHIIDREMEPVPIWVWGQLVISGAGLARGYLGRPELTAERFLPNPFSKAGDERIYLTGDLARYREDGNIEFFGRIDHQVKIRGFRIELGEIEATLLKHPAVRQAAVACRQDGSGDKILAAYIVPGDGGAPSPASLRTFLQEKLPEYMVPSAFVVLESLPFMTSGKVDRGALPAPERTREAAGEPYTPPETEAQMKLAAIFGEVLSLDRVGMNDSFFSLGGHSLSATRVMSRIREVFHVDLPLRSIFESPSVAGLAAALETAIPSEDDDEQIEVISGPAEREPRPLGSLLDDLSADDLESLLAEIAARRRG